MDRLKRIKLIRKKLANGDCSIGSWMQIPHSSIAEIMGAAGYDWVAVDMEHGAISVHQLPDLFRALELGGTLPLVRLANGNIKECKQVLDAGAGGVIVPMVESAAHLERVRNFTRWPPEGKRGVAFSRANLFGKTFETYREEAQQPLLVAMIEHIDTVKKLDSILNVKGLDAIMIGPYDLSASMGLTADFKNPEFINAMQLIKAKVDDANIPFGMHIVNPSKSELKLKIKNNYRFIAYSIDGVFLNNIVTKPSL
jgi:2-dehydro-3-deoxyglucarate aldolase